MSGRVLGRKVIRRWALIGLTTRQVCRIHVHALLQCIYKGQVKVMVTNIVLCIVYSVHVRRARSTMIHWLHIHLYTILSVPAHVTTPLTLMMNLMQTSAELAMILAELGRRMMS